MISVQQYQQFQFQSNLSLSSYLTFSEETLKTDKIKDYLSRFIDFDSPKVKVCSKRNHSELKQIPEDFLQAYASLQKINGLKGINDFLRTVNRKLPKGGIMVVCAETLEQRRIRIFTKYPPYIYMYPFYLYDFLINRVLPKLSITSKIYFKLKKNNNRVLSVSEILGRLVFSGFKIRSVKHINNLTYFVTEKEREPVSNVNPVYGLILKMNRVGKDGKLINVYKIRTMYPYSEFLQKFIYDNFNLSKGGKFKNDMRITGWGKILRKYWLDEIPMIFNWLKGDMKIVGLRPLSEHYLSLYNSHLAENRFTVKPGLIPPFYQDLPGTLEEIMKSEEKYIELYKKNPLKTDISYFFHAVVNILFKGARSS